MSLQLEYEMRLHEADSETKVNAISFEIRGDVRLSNRDRNTLFIVCANRRNELSGKDGSRAIPPPVTGEIPVPANPGGMSMELAPTPIPLAAGELSLAEAKDLWDKFQAFKMAVIARGDYDEINGKKDLNRSGWSKIGTALGISVQILDREVTGTREALRISFWVRASKGSRYVDNVGSAESSDVQGGTGSFHMVETKAYTRAMKRAIADLVGGAETE